jgi:hypothetical protein
MIVYFVTRCRVGVAIGISSRRNRKRQPRIPAGRPIGRIKFSRPGCQNETPLSSARETPGENASSVASTQTLSFGDQKFAPDPAYRVAPARFPKSGIHTYPAESGIDISKDAMQKRQKSADRFPAML